MSARTEDHDQIRAIMSGGDDYITKPFAYELLLAKIQSQLRRVYGEYSIKESKVLHCQDCSFNSSKLVLECGGQTAELSKNESILIRLLFSAYPDLVKREQILSEIWDTELFIEENTLNVTVSRVRQKIRDLGSRIEIGTVRGLGYRIEDDE